MSSTEVIKENKTQTFKGKMLRFSTGEFSKLLPFKFLLCGKSCKDFFFFNHPKQNVVLDFRPVSLWEALETMAMLKPEPGWKSGGSSAPGEIPGEQMWIPQCCIQGRNQVFPEEFPVSHLGEQIQAPLWYSQACAHIWGTAGAQLGLCATSPLQSVPAPPWGMPHPLFSWISRPNQPSSP